MKALRILVPIVMVTLVSGCALTDKERGTFVSSSVQMVALPPLPHDGAIAVAPFQYPKDSSVVVGGTYMNPFPYVFDDVDRHNLRQSLLSSLRTASKAGVADLQAESAGGSESSVLVTVKFTKLGMGVSTFGMRNTVCLMDAEVSVRVGSEVKKKAVSIIGESGWTVAGSKDKAIQELVYQVAQLIASPLQ